MREIMESDPLMTTLELRHLGLNWLAVQALYKVILLREPFRNEVKSSNSSVLDTVCQSRNLLKRTPVLACSVDDH